jgi:hypothetical protein
MFVSPAASCGVHSVFSPAILGRGDDPGSLARVAQADLYGDKAVRAKAGTDGEGDAGKAELEMGELQPLAAAGDLPPGGARGRAKLGPQRLPSFGGGVDSDGGKDLEHG